MWSLSEQDLQSVYKVYQQSAMRKVGKYEEGGEGSWVEFLKGKNPDYPIKTLNAAFERIRSGVEGMRKDRSTPDTRRSDGPQRYSRAATSALVNLTMGGIQPLWAGGLLYCQLRYFDPIERRPGLPEDTGALIHTIDDEKITVTLVNISQVNTHDIILQGGAYGEHQIIRVEYNETEFPVQDKYFTVRLAPGSGSTLTIYRQRFAHTPTLAFPWHGDRVPLLLNDE